MPLIKIQNLQKKIKMVHGRIRSWHVL